MSFDDRVAAVDIATQFQESSKEVFKMVEEETEVAKTQVLAIMLTNLECNCDVPPLLNNNRAWRLCGFFIFLLLSIYFVHKQFFVIMLYSIDQSSMWGSLVYYQ
jgi:hypothetical protein